MTVRYIDGYMNPAFGEGTALNYQVLSETVSAVRRSKSKVEMDEAMVACCAPIREDYKRRHKNRTRV